MPYLSLVTLLVPSYSEALSFFQSISFLTLSDIPAPSTNAPSKRWVVVAPPASNKSAAEPTPRFSCGILLAEATTPAQKAVVGKQAGDRVFLFYATDNFERDYMKLKNAGVEFLERPRQESYGTVVQWKDVWGNKWDLIESTGEGTNGSFDG